MEETNKNNPEEKKDKVQAAKLPKSDAKDTKKEVKSTESKTTNSSSKKSEEKKTSDNKTATKKTSTSSSSKKKTDASTKTSEAKKPTVKKDSAANKKSSTSTAAKKTETPKNTSDNLDKKKTVNASADKKELVKTAADNKETANKDAVKEEKKAEVQEKAKTFGEKFVHFFKRNEYTVNQNLRLVSIVLAIVLAFGMFQPLMGFSFGVDLKTGDTGVDAVSGKSVSIVPTSSYYPSANIGDLVMHKQLKDFEIFGTKIADLEILGLNIYQFATTPFPDFRIIKNLDAALDSEWIQFLTSDQFAILCKNFLGEENAQGVIDLAKTIVSISKTTGEALDQVINVLSTLSTAKTNLTKSIHAAEDAVTTVEHVVAAIMLVFLLGLVLSMFKRLPRFLGAGIMTPIAVIFLGLCIGIAVANGMINSAINPADGSINDTIRAVIATNFPDIARLISGFIDMTQVNFVFVAKILVGTGLIITTICVTGCTVLAYVIGARNKGLVGKERN